MKRIPFYLVLNSSANYGMKLTYNVGSGWSVLTKYGCV